MCYYFLKENWIGIGLDNYVMKEEIVPDFIHLNVPIINSVYIPLRMSLIHYSRHKGFFNNILQMHRLHVIKMLLPS